MRFRAVIFDLDGTLLDTIGDIAGSVNTVLERRGLKTFPSASYRMFVGDGMEMLVRRVIPGTVQDDESIASVLREVREEYRLRWNRTTVPYQGIEALLEGLEERDIAMSVLSNKPHEFTELMIGHYFPGIFRFVQGLLPGIPRKPDPTAALALARRLATEPKEIIFLGDSGNDMRAAGSAGMYPAGAQWGYRERDELLEGGAAVILARPLDVLKIL